jgi:hypothetical protein
MIVPRGKLCKVNLVIERCLMSAAALVNEYLNAFYSGDFATARNFVADDYRFEGPFVQAVNKDEYFASAAGLAPVVKGHKLLQQWEHGAEVCSIYDVCIQTPAGEGAVTMSEWHTASSGQLQSSRLVMDTAIFRALMPRPDQRRP